MHRFFDAHLHLMTIQHPDLVAFLNALNGSLGKSLRQGAGFSAFLSFGKTPHTLLNQLENLLVTMEGSLERVLELLEADLKGSFSSTTPDAPYPAMPFWRDGAFHFRGRTYDRVVLCPLLMDFSETDRKAGSRYYAPPAEDRIIRYARETLEAMDRYEEEYGAARCFDLVPFLGITPPAHTEAEIERLLTDYVATDHAMPRKGHGRKRFLGVKAYPPLGFNPWPHAKDEKRKVRTIYEFCQTYRVPIVTHCDDQGFRTITPDAALRYTDPRSWEPVFKHYPGLVVDFAHFGMRYGIKGHAIQAMARHLPSSDWFTAIIDLMRRYEGVYADVSFSGCVPSFYEELAAWLDDAAEADRARVEERLLFGTDFSINLLKVESYSEFLERYAESPLGDRLVRAMTETNPEAFLGLTE